MSGLETDGELPVPTKTTTATKSNNQIQSQKLNSNKEVVDIVKNQDMSSQNF